MKKDILVKTVAYIFAGAVLLTSLAFAYTVFRPIDVLANWTITTDKTTYQPGEKIWLTSKLTKLMDVDGQSTRYLVCQLGDAEERIELQKVDANRSSGTKTVATSVTIPEEIDGLPRTCHIEAVVRYQIYGYRQFIEVGDSNTFTINT